MAKGLKMTGERIIPNDIRTPIEYIQFLRHLFVYEHVKNEISGNENVLEAGFGEGYGARMLSETCREIVGIDVEKQVVEYAADKYSNNKCSFKLYNGNVIPFDDETFDVAISFQVIEHIHNDAGFISQLHRVLKKGGRLYLTTPNRATRLKPGQKPWNRFHIREYYAHELDALLGKIFRDVKVSGISATDEIHHIEADRIKQGFFLSLALRLGLRKLIPEFIDPLIARLISAKKSNKVKSIDNQELKSRFSLDDFRIETIKVDESLDLFARAIKDKG